MERRVQVAFKQLKQVVYDRNGNVVERVPAGGAIVEVSTAWQRPKGWRIANVVAVKS
jgi:hypothetical protein